MNKNLEKTAQKWLETRFINSSLIVSKNCLFEFKGNKKAIDYEGYAKKQRAKKPLITRVRLTHDDVVCKMKLLISKVRVISSDPKQFSENSLIVQ